MGKTHYWKSANAKTWNTEILKMAVRHKIILAI